MLRWLLIAANTAVCATLVTMVVRHPYGGNTTDYIMVGGIFVTCVLNALYVLRSQLTGFTYSKPRLWRLFDLWLTTKEEELRSRAGSKNQIPK